MKERTVFKLTPEQQKQLGEARIKWQKKIKPFKETIKKSRTLTAADFAVRINATSENTGFLQKSKKKGRK